MKIKNTKNVKVINSKNIDLTETSSVFLIPLTLTKIIFEENNYIKFKFYNPNNIWVGINWELYDNNDILIDSDHLQAYKTDYLVTDLIGPLEDDTLYRVDFYAYRENYITSTTRSVSFTTAGEIENPYDIPIVENVIISYSVNSSGQWSFSLNGINNDILLSLLMNKPVYIQLIRYHRRIKSKTTRFFSSSTFNTSKRIPHVLDHSSQIKSAPSDKVAKFDISSFLQNDTYFNINSANVDAWANNMIKYLGKNCQTSYNKGYFSRYGNWFHRIKFDIMTYNNYLVESACQIMKVYYTYFKGIENFDLNYNDIVLTPGNYQIYVGKFQEPEVTSNPEFWSISSTTNSISYRIENKDSSSATIYSRLWGESWTSHGIIGSEESTSTITISGLLADSDFLVEAYAHASGKTESSAIPQEISTLPEGLPKTTTPRVELDSKTDTSIVFKLMNDHDGDVDAEWTILEGGVYDDDGTLEIPAESHEFLTRTGLQPSTSYTLSNFRVKQKGSGYDWSDPVSLTVFTNSPMVATPGVWTTEITEDFVEWRVANNHATSVNIDTRVNGKDWQGAEDITDEDVFDQDNLDDDRTYTIEVYVSAQGYEQNNVNLNFTTLKFLVVTGKIVAPSNISGSFSYKINGTSPQNITLDDQQQDITNTLRGGSDLEITAPAIISGCAFVRWKVNGVNQTLSNNTLELFDIENNLNLEAVYVNT